MSESRKYAYHLTFRVLDATGATQSIGYRCFDHRPTDGEVEACRAALLAENINARQIVIARIP